MGTLPVAPLVLAAAVVLLAVTGSGPGPAQHGLGTGTGTGTADDPLAAVLAVVTLLAWATCGWLLLTMAATAGGHLPGRAGRLLAASARRLAPVAVRRTVELTLGLTVVVGAIAGPAAASSAAGRPTAAPPSLDWGGRPAAAPALPAATPVPAGAVAAPDLDWVPASATAVTGPPAAPAGAQPVVVQPGDTLWCLAEAALEARTGTQPTDQEIAHAWPTWWAANRDAVGPDPHLLLPGTALQAPPTG